MDAIKNYIIPNCNYRDGLQWLPYATINELTVLSNLETHNAQMIREGKSKEDIYDEWVEYIREYYQ